MTAEQKKERKETLIAACADELQDIIETAVDKMVFLEDKLEELEKLPFIRFDPKNPYRQKDTPAAKQYKMFFQQYINALKIVEKAAHSEDKQTLSPLREWVMKRTESL